MPKIHHSDLSILKTVFTELETGTEIKLVIRLACYDFCDLRGNIIKLIDKNGTVQEVALTKFNGVENETEEVTVMTSIEPGEYSWTTVFSALEENGILHEEITATYTFSYRPHSVSIAVWDIPVIIQRNTPFKAKVGMKCSAGCKLAGNKIEIYDHQTNSVASGILGDIPWQGTGALYWTEVELKAPDAEGYYTWHSKSSIHDMENPHLETSFSFSFTVVNPPEVIVTIEVIDKEDNTPLKDADVILHPYRAKTNENGKAVLEVPRGGYQLYVIGEEKYGKYMNNVIVIDNMTITAELIIAPVLVGDF